MLPREVADLIFPLVRSRAFARPQSRLGSGVQFVVSSAAVGRHWWRAGWCTSSSGLERSAAPTNSRRSVSATADLTTKIDRLQPVLLCSDCCLVSSPVQWRLSLAHPPLTAKLATPALSVPSPQLATSARRLARSMAARASGFSCRRSASSSTVAATSRGRTGRPFASTNGPSVSVSSRSEGSPATS